MAKSSHLRIVLIVIVLAGAGLLSAVRAQQRSTKAAAPLRVALVDLQWILENYKKLADLRTELKESGEAAQSKAEGLMGQLKSIQEELQGGDLEEGGPEWVDHEKKAIALTTRLQSLEQQTKRNLSRQQAQALKSAYHEVQDALARFSEYNGFTLVLQINNAITEGTEPSQVQRKLGQGVVYRRDGEDISQPVLKWLNDQYAREPQPAAAATKTSNKKTEGPKERATEGQPSRKPAAAKSR
ncbi:MAG: OmpH family outer membrane protein [Planctomycetaceae bacterium]